MPLELLCVGNRLRESAAGGRWVLRVQPFAQWYLLNSARYLDLFSFPHLPLTGLYSSAIVSSVIWRGQSTVNIGKCEFGAANFGHILGRSWEGGQHRAEPVVAAV